MFKDYVSATAFTSEAANDYFAERITGGAYSGDYSFISTMRALLDKRMPDGAKINLVIKNSYLRSGDFPKADAEDGEIANAVRKIIGGSVSADTFYIYTFASGKELNEQNMKFLEEHFTGHYPGWKRLDNVTSLFSGSNFRVACYVNETLKSTIVFASDFTIRKYHLLQCALLGMLPWYFENPNDVTDVEKKLIYAMLGDREESYRQYIECLEIIAGNYDFDSVRVRKLLKGFENKYKDIERSNAKREIAETERAIDNLNSSLQGLIVKLRNAQARMLGFDLMINESGPTMLDYFESHKNMYLENVSGTSLTFSVRGYLAYYDPELYKNLMRSDRCYAYRYVGDDLTFERIKKLLDAVFLEQEIRIRVCAAYKIDISGSAYGLEDHRFDAKFNDYYPNPHIRYHGCLGDNRAPINDAIRNGNYLLAMESCVASCMNLFFGDPTVANEFFGDIMSDRTSRYYELPDGRNVNIMEAIKWLEDRDNNNETEE